MKKTIIIERINQTHEFFEKHCIESEFMKTCPLQIKKYFDYKDFKTMNTEFHDCQVGRQLLPAKNVTIFKN